MEKQQAQYIADYINHELDNYTLRQQYGRGIPAHMILASWEVDASMILVALATWTDQRDKRE